MEENKVYTAIGLMSGTSVDGIDAALIRTDGQDHIERLDFRSFPYPKETREAVRACFGQKKRSQDVEVAERLITQAHIDAVSAFGHYADVIGFHGQTITHDPDDSFTWQIGDAERLASQTGMNVVADMRLKDMEEGGQGAPMLPLYHAAMASDVEKPAAVLNLGGVGNVTWIGPKEGQILAFDTGPANALLDDFVMARLGQSYDEGGKLAAQGRPYEKLLEKWMTHSYFNRPPPKSLDRNDWDVKGIENLPDEDGAATLLEFTVRSVLKSAEHFPGSVRHWYVSGGGRHNHFMMKRLGQVLGRPVDPVEELGWNGDAIEAEGFAYLAIRSLLGYPLTVPGTTGVKQPQPGGRLYRAV